MLGKKGNFGILGAMALFGPLNPLMNDVNISLMCLCMKHSAQACHGISRNFRTRMGQDQRATEHSQQYVATDVVSGSLLNV